MTVIPMFPLGSVLLPTVVLPLHVFEPRYRALVHDCRAGANEFGVVLIARGLEVGGGDVRTDVGTIARLVDLTEAPDGRYGVLAVGTDRLRVVGWEADDPYPRADVERWPDADDAAGPVDVEGALDGLRRLLALAAEAGWDVGPAIDAVDVATVDDPVVASYQLSALAPLGPADRQRLLCCPGPRSRLTLLGELFADAEAVIRFGLQPDS